MRLTILAALLLLAAPCEARRPVYTFAGRISPFCINPQTCEADTVRFTGPGWTEGWVIWNPLPGPAPEPPDTFMVCGPFDFTAPDTSYHAYSFTPMRSGIYRCAVDVVVPRAGRLSDWCPLQWGDPDTVILPPQSEVWMLNLPK
jgi:hypothetical protein